MRKIISASSLVAGVVLISACSSPINLGEEVLVDSSSDESHPDGSESTPFENVYDALAAIKDDPDWEGSLVLAGGVHKLPDDLVLPKRAQLRILAGATLKMGPVASIHAQADIEALGTEEEPITFTWLTSGKHWGSLTNFEPTSQDNVFEWVIFEHGYENNFNDIAMRGALSLHSSKARISHCTFRDNEGDDGLNMKKSSTLVEHCLFENNASDALDSDGDGDPEIAYSRFVNNGNDAVDLGEGTRAYVHHNFIAKSGDKGISNGEGSLGVMEHNLVVLNSVGIGIKDDADPIMRYNTVYGNYFGLRIFREDTEAGGGKGSFENGIVWGSKTQDILLEIGTTVISHSCVQSLENGDALEVEPGEGLVTEGDGCEDPLFVNPDDSDVEKLDYHLKSEEGRWDEETEEWVKDDETSSCIDLGDPDAEESEEPDPNGGRVNLGMYAATEWASKSP